MIPAASAIASRSLPSYQAPPVGRATEGITATIASLRTLVRISATSEVTTVERQIVADVRRTVRERDRLLRGLTAAETSVEVARKEVEVAELRYQRGLSNNLDVVAAETSLLMAESRRIQALADSAVAVLRLRAVLGVLNPRSDIAAPSSPLPFVSTQP